MSIISSIRELRQIRKIIFFADYPYYLTNLLLNGTDITTDEQIISITDNFNKLPSDKNYSQIEVAILEPNKKWELEDKRWLQYLEHDDDFELHDENGEVIYYLQINSF